MTVVTPPEAFDVYLPKRLNVVPDPVRVPEIVILVLCDAKAKDAAIIALPSGVAVVVVVVVGDVGVVVVAPADVATSTVRKLKRVINSRGALPVIAFPLVPATYEDDVHRIPGLESRSKRRGPRTDG